MILGTPKTRSIIIISLFILSSLFTTNMVIDQKQSNSHAFTPQSIKTGVQNLASHNKTTNLQSSKKQGLQYDQQNNPGETIKLSSTEHPKLVRDNTGSGRYAAHAFGNFTKDQVTDTVIGSDGGNIRIIDGATTETLYEFDLNYASITEIKTLNVTNDGIDDIIISGIFSFDSIGSGYMILDGARPDPDNPLKVGSLLNTITGITVDDFYKEGTSKLVIATFDGVNITRLKITNLDDLSYNKTIILKSTQQFQLIASSDFNTDNVSDIILLSESTTITYDIKTPSIIFNHTRSISSRDLAVDDVTGDGIDDIVVGGILIDGSTGSEVFQSGEEMNTIADIDNDDELEIITSNGINRIYIYNSTGDLENSLNITSSLLDGPTDIYVFDYNDDGLRDYIVQTTIASLKIYNSTDAAVLFQYNDFHDRPLQIMMSDTNSDGRDDISIISADGIFTTLLKDNYDPVLNEIRLPELRTSQFQIKLKFSEPYYNQSNIYYLIGNQVQKQTASKVEKNIATFNIYLNYSDFQFWLSLTDDFGHNSTAGSKTNPYIFSINPTLTINKNFLDYGIPIETLGVVKNPTTIDFDHDGNLEIVSNGVSTYYNPFPESFSSIKYYDPVEKTFDRIMNIPGNIGYIASGEVTGDGNKDLIVTTINSTGIKVYIDDFTDTSWDSAFVEGQFDQDFHSITLQNVDNDPTNEIIINADDKINIIQGNTLAVSNITFGSHGIIQKYDMRQVNQDKQDVITLNLENDQIVVRDGDTSGLLWATNPDWTVLDYELGNFDDDVSEEIAVLQQGGGRSHLFIYTLSGSLLTSYEFGVSSYVDLIRGKFDEDSSTDLMLFDKDHKQLTAFSLSKEEVIYFTYIDNFEFRDHPDNQILQTNEVTNDATVDIMMVGETQILSINGKTGKVYDTYEHTAPITSNVEFADIDGNGVQELIFTDLEGNVIGYQSQKTYTSLYYDLEYPDPIQQGALAQIRLQVFDYDLDPITGAEVTLTAIRSGTQEIISVVGIDQGQGEYLFNFTTENWEIGEWQLYPTLNRDPYDSITLNDYSTIIGKMISGDKLVIMGRVSPYVELTNQGISSTNRRMTGIVEGTTVRINLRLFDRFNHQLQNTSSTPIEMLIQFRGNQSNMIFGDNNTIARGKIDTKDIQYGSYQVQISINGTYLHSQDMNLTLEVIPSLPKLKITLVLLLQIGLIALAVSTIFILYWKQIYASLDNNPMKVNTLLKRIGIINGFLFLLSLGLTYYLYISAEFNNIQNYLFSMIPIGLSILMFFTIYLKLSLNQYFNQKFVLTKYIKIIPLSLIVGILVGISLYIGNQSQWISYQMNQSTTDILIAKIPTLVWEIGIYGFATGFLYVIFSDAYDTYTDIKELDQLQDEVEHGYYPKEPNKLYDSTVDQIRESFISVSKGMLLWFAIIILTSLTTLKLQLFIPLVLVVVIAIAVVALIFFRLRLLNVVKL